MSILWNIALPHQMDLFHFYHSQNLLLKWIWKILLGSGQYSSFGGALKNLPESAEFIKVVLMVQ